MESEFERAMEPFAYSENSGGTFIIIRVIDKAVEGSIVIPSGVSSIGEDAFRNCNSLTDVSLPDSVTFIDFWAFHECSSLKSVTIPQNCQLNHRAFDEDCTVTRR